MGTEVKAVIFDLDGVIVSTDNLHYEAWSRICKEENIPFDRIINDRLRGVSRMESLDIILERTSRLYTEPQKQELAERKNGYYKDLLSGISEADLLDGVEETLDALQNRGIRTAIGSSSRNARAILAQLGIAGRFDVIVDGNELARSKPDPEVFTTAAKKLELLPVSCLVVEDAEAGVRAAAAAGMVPAAVGTACGSPLAVLHLDRLPDLLPYLEKASAASTDSGSSDSIMQGGHY
ncbi:beta-phosphoglucomutase [Paenibacillus sp. MMS20-IR301]|uniref:beta-phosphoglucomutase n=1 Tax=Paenibacillus sp. MMS20-IR301 TaxID=2895946 RepID=UPI0028E53F72|nr:beta-phosphoglucomutase [Paenibacillus sp. MMS20-IR301]WNS44119.1 beta-phosphoglucomutase [Paenibacillus sp. MMS20-IR301]